MTKTQERYGEVAFTNDRWNAEMDGKKINLALVCETFNLDDIEHGHENDVFPVVMECSVMPHPKHIAKSYKESAKNSSGGSTIFDIFDYGGGIPVSDILEGIKSSAQSSIDNELRTQKHATFGNKIKVRHFKDEEDAVQFAKDVYSNNADALFMLIGFTLDKPINRIGKTGWDRIDEFVTGKSKSY